MFTICREKYIAGKNSHTEEYLELVLNDINDMIRYMYGNKSISIFRQNDNRYEDDYLYTVVDSKINIYEKQSYRSNDGWVTCGTDYKLILSVQIPEGGEMPKGLCLWNMLDRCEIENQIIGQSIQEIEHIVHDLLGNSNNI